MAISLASRCTYQHKLIHLSVVPKHITILHTTEMEQIGRHREASDQQLKAWMKEQKRDAYGREWVDSGCLGSHTLPKGLHETVK